MSIEAMKQALETIQIMKAGHCVEEQIYMNKTIAALEAELAKQEFYPDWDMIKPFHERIKELEAELAKPDLSIEANRVAYDVAMHYANKTKEKLG